ncbi:MAG: LysR substrate-binding domain-containing protein [Arenicella sp.]|jgi:DNA-binding transcriptional LysR family regulator|nr:LysR substrate-binding domain-containing protein [Arenicella sp.]
MDQLRALKYFAAVAEFGSFTEAAKQFSVPPSSLSRRVADLEESLGASLLKRTTRSVQLTEIGREYFAQVKDILHQLDQSNESVRSYHAKPTGYLKISSMVSFGERILIPLLDEFSTLYPEVILDISLSDELSSLGHDDVDIAIRGGYAPNERVLAIRLMDNEFIPVASPAYLAKNGTPKHPRDLSEHRGLYYRTPVGPQTWLYEQDQQWHTVPVPEVAISNNGQWLANRALNDEGILLAPRWALADYIRRGELQELMITPKLKITQKHDFAIYLLHQKQRYLVPKVKVTVDFLVAKITGKY